MRIKTSLMSISLIFISLILGGCVTTDNTPVGQAAVKNFETRSVDATFDEVYSAATEGLFDLGYTIQHSDKATGVLVGEKKVNKQNKIVIEIADILAEKETHKEDLSEMLQLTLYIQPVDPKSTKVRIKTAVDKTPTFNKSAIDEVWVYIQRQVLMEGKVPEAKKEEVKK